MNACAMARGLKQRVVDDNVGLYASLLATTGAATEPVWIDGMRLFRSLSAEDQAAFMAFVRNAVIDSVSSVLAIVDGVSVLDGQEGEVVMTCGRDVVSGDLQSEFLVLFEDS
jgi:hypothetical protein